MFSSYYYKTISVWVLIGVGWNHTVSRHAGMSTSRHITSWPTFWYGLSRLKKWLVMHPDRLYFLFKDERRPGLFQFLHTLA